MRVIVGIVVALATFVAGFDVGASQGNVDMCHAPMRVTYVARASQADVRIHYVTSGEDVRVRFRRYPHLAGEWAVVGNSEPHDLAVYVDPQRRPGTIDVRVVAYGQGCTK